METSEQRTLKAFEVNSVSVKTKEINSKNKSYSSPVRKVVLYLPIIITIFNIGDEVTINRTIDGFLIKRAGLDSTRTLKLSSRTIPLKSHMYDDLVGEYDFEIIDEDTLKIIKIT